MQLNTNTKTKKKKKKDSSPPAQTSPVNKKKTNPETNGKQDLKKLKKLKKVDNGSSQAKTNVLILVTMTLTHGRTISTQISQSLKFEKDTPPTFLPPRPQ